MSLDPHEIDRLLADTGDAPIDGRVRSLLRALRDDLRRPPEADVAERHLARIIEAARSAPERLTLRVRAARFATRLMAATTVKVLVGTTAAVAATSGLAATGNVPDPVQQIAQVVVRTIVPLPSEDTRLARDAVVAVEPVVPLVERAAEPEEPPVLREAAAPTKPKSEAVSTIVEEPEDEPRPEPPPAPAEEEPAEEEQVCLIAEDPPSHDKDDEPVDDTSDAGEDDADDTEEAEGSDDPADGSDAEETGADCYVGDGGDGDDRDGDLDELASDDEDDDGHPSDRRRSPRTVANGG